MNIRIHPRCLFPNPCEFSLLVILLSTHAPQAVFEMCLTRINPQPISSAPFQVKILACHLWGHIRSAKEIAAVKRWNICTIDSGAFLQYYMLYSLRDAGEIWLNTNVQDKLALFYSMSEFVSVCLCVRVCVYLPMCVCMSVCMWVCVLCQYTWGLWLGLTPNQPRKQVKTLGKWLGRGLVNGPLQHCLMKINEGF